MKTLSERFSALFVPGRPDECWPWRGAQRGRGYGKIRLGGAGGGKEAQVHRVAWQLANGEIPPGLCILHTCDNPPCVNPAHLILGTQLENVADRNAKRRQARLCGESNAAARLSAAQVSDIRRHGTMGILSQPQIAAMYGVSRSHVGSILRGDRWAERAERGE